MNKIVLNKTSGVTIAEFPFLGDENQVVKVKTRLSLEDISKLTQAFVSEFLNPESVANNTNGLLAEMSFQGLLLDLATNIDISQPEFYKVLDETSLFDDVIQKIENYHDVRIIITDTLDYNMKLQGLDKKLGDAVDNVTTALLQFFEKLNSTEISEETIAKLKSLVEDAKSAKLID